MSAAPARAGALSVLVVDDEEGQRILAAVALREAGFEVHVAFDGQSAIASAARVRPDLVLMDVWMPGMDGFAACERILALPECRRTQVIILSGDDRPDNVERARTAGATATVPKMWDWREYVRTVREFLPAAASGR